MRWLVALVGVLVAGLGALGVARPAALLALVARAWRARSTLAVAAGFRLLFGVALIVAAPRSRAPTVLALLGAVSIVSGLAALVVGYERALRFIDWWQARSGGVVRAWASVALAFGIALVWAVV